MPVDDAAQVKQRPLDVGAPADLRWRIAGHPRTDARLRIVEIQLRQVLEQVHVAIVVRLDRPDVAPVAVERESVDLHRAVLDHRRDDVTAEIVRGIVPLRVGDELVDERLPVEDVNAHRDQVGLRAVRLLLELDDAILVILGQHAVAVRFRHRHFIQRHRDVCAVRQMVGDQLVVVHLVDVVARQDQHELRPRLLDEVDVLGDGVGGAAIPVRAVAAQVRLQQRHAAALPVQIPRPADADVVVERSRPVLREHADPADAGVHAVAQREVDDPVAAAVDHRRFGALLAEHAQPVSLAARQDQCHDSLHR